MAGVAVIKIIGAFVRWIFTGFTKNFWKIYKDEEERQRKHFSTNLIIGALTLIIIVLLLYA